jgi:lipoprotein-anchoring transpeptidase ErfK/SrfK
MSPDAKAQSFFDQLFGTSGGQSGRQTVRFPGSHAPGTIIVSFGDRRLYYIEARGRAISYPIAIPKSEARWAGVSYVSQKRENPSWTPTPQMRRENPKLPPFVPGGDPRNPMGVRALYLGSSLYRIHGTDAPWLIGQEVSKGCIRMYNDDVIHLYQRARVGARVVVTWQRFGTMS